MATPMIDPSQIRITSVSLRRTESFRDRMGNEQYGLTADVLPGQSAPQVTLALQAVVDAHFQADRLCSPGGLPWWGRPDEIAAKQQAVLAEVQGCTPDAIAQQAVQRQS